MTNITHIGDIDGLSPKIRIAADKLSNSIFEALDAAQGSGVPVDCVIGRLEIIKAAVIASHFDSADIEGE